MLERKIGDFVHILENVVYFELLRRGYDVYIGKIDEYEVDFVAINNEGRLYVQVTDTLKGIDENDTKILDRELRSLKKINDKTKNQEDKNEKFQKPLTNLPKPCTIDCTNS